MEPTIKYVDTGAFGGLTFFEILPAIVFLASFFIALISVIIFIVNFLRLGIGIGYKREELKASGALWMKRSAILLVLTILIWFIMMIIYNYFFAPIIHPAFVLPY